MKGKFVRRYLLVCAGFLAALLLIVREYVLGVLSPRGFGIAVLIAMVPVFFALSYIIKRARQELRTDAAVKVGASTIWTLRLAIVMLLLFLVNGVWQYRHGPFLPVLVGATVNLFITGTLIRLLMRVQRNAR